MIQDQINMADGGDQTNWVSKVSSCVILAVCGLEYLLRTTLLIKNSKWIILQLFHQTYTFHLFFFVILVLIEIFFSYRRGQRAFPPNFCELFASVRRIKLHFVIHCILKTHNELENSIKQKKITFLSLSSTFEVVCRDLLI